MSQARIFASGRAKKCRQHICSAADCPHRDKGIDGRFCPISVTPLQVCSQPQTRPQHPCLHNTRTHARPARPHGICKVYNAGTPIEAEVLHGVDLTLARGEFAALIGPSGSGKSTLLNIIGLLEKSSGGTYRLAGTAIDALDDAALTAARLATLGFVFQFHHLLPAFSALDNVAMPVLIRDGRVNAAARARAAQLLADVGLANASDKKPTQLSGGMQQRVAIARSLMLDPPLVLADEPTGNLDTASANAVFELLRRFNRDSGTAFLIVTHDPRIAARCDRVIELIDGRVVAGAEPPP
jgi:lipoprotein-releasing system ATP-binding protein